MVNSFLKVKQFLEVEKIKLDKGHLLCKFFRNLIDFEESSLQVTPLVMEGI